MNPWRNFPLVRIACSLGAGAGMELVCPGLWVPPLWVPGLLMIFVAVLAMSPGWISNYRHRWIRGLLILSVLFLSGVCLVDQREPTHGLEDFLQDPLPGVYFGNVTEQPLIGKKTLRIFADLASQDSSGTIIGSGSSVITAEYDQHGDLPGIGDVLIFSGYLGRIGERDNPGGFDRKRWYGIKGIALESYARKGEWKIIHRGGQWSIKRCSDRIRSRLLTVLRESGLSGQEFAVASALLLGYVHDIDKDLMKGYSATGAMHVLSVSGMHVGVVYLFLEFMLGFMRRNRTLVIAKMFIIILSIWFYAFLTGLSPPVTRAALMLSLVVGGKALTRSPEILNIVAASFLCQLILDPLILGDIGFQFSYLAVIGIVLMYRPFYDLYVTSNVFADKAWALIAVSVAAQLATFPLGLYAFHQFPNYFLLTNFVVVPFSNFIIYTGILVLVVGSVPNVGPFCGMVLSWMIRALNGSIMFIGGLPGAVTGGICISEIQLILIFLMIISLFLFFLKKRSWLLMLFLITLILFQVEGLRMDEGRLPAGRQEGGRKKEEGRGKKEEGGGRKEEGGRRKEEGGRRKEEGGRTRGEFVVYKAGGMTVADFIYGDRELLVRSDPHQEMGDFFRSVLTDHWIHKGVRLHSASFLEDNSSCNLEWDHPLLPLYRHGNFFLFGNKRIYFLRSTIIPFAGATLSLDYLVIGGDVTNELRDILQMFDPGMIILDSSCKRWRSREWMKEASIRKIPVYCVGEEGAFISII